MTTPLSNNDKLIYGIESVWGTTPANAKTFRGVSFSPTHDKSVTQSSELTGFRELIDVIETQQRSTMQANFELSYGNLDDLLVSLFANTWVLNSPGAGSDTLKVGNTRQSISFERQLSDLSTPQYLTYKGAQLTQLTIDCAIGKILTGAMSAVGKPVLSATSSAFSGSIAAAPTNVVMDPISFLQLAQEGGSGSIAGLTEFSLQLATDAVEIPQIGVVSQLDVLPGRFTASGSFSCYFADATYLTKHLAHTTTSLAFSIGGSASLKYAITFPKVKLMLDGVPNGGINQPLIQKVSFQAIRDATDTTCKIIRTN